MIFMKTLNNLTTEVTDLHGGKKRNSNKKLRVTPFTLWFIILIILLFSSCFGVNADIVLNQNGSGTIALEYLVSKSLDSLGRLDGNERWNTIPVGKADFERTLERLPEMRLLSFSSKEDGKNLVISAKMEFSSISGLLAFLDASGGRSSFSGSAVSGRMLLTLSEGADSDAGTRQGHTSPPGSINPELNKLIAGISDGYSVRMSMSFPAEGSLALLDSQGRPSAAIPASEIHSSGKKVSFIIPLYQVLSSVDGINAVFSW